MGISYSIAENGVAEVIMDNPPVNALTVAGWYEVARVMDEVGANPDVRVVILTATGKGFNAGVDIKEMHADQGFDKLLGANHGCYAAFKAVYECKVPVIAAVNDFCLGGGVGLVGNADLVIAVKGAKFGLPEVKQGALGAATHLARLVPQQRMRYMVYSCEPITAEELYEYGTVLKVVEREDLMDEARKVAASIACNPGVTIRAAKECLNGIDPVDVNLSYRFEQGFTFQLNLSGVSDEARGSFVEDKEAWKK